MPCLSAIRAFNASQSFSYHPVAVFVGGTAGIGQGMAEAFARHTKGNASIYLVGRNKDRAQAILNSLNAPEGSDPTKYKREFIQCDVTLMKNIHGAANEILAKEPKINHLVITTGMSSTKGRVPTEEGIDRKMAVHYYGRWRFIHDLMPALLRAKEAGEDAKVATVMAAGKGGEIDINDLGMEKSYSLTKAALVAPTYNDLMSESFAALYPSLTFVHAYPGFVRTGLIASSDSPIVASLSPILIGLTYPVSTSIEETGEYLWHGLYNAQAGASRVGSRGEDIGKKRYFGTDEQRQKLWEHTAAAVRVKGE